MIQLRWEDGAPIEGVAVTPGKEGAPPTFKLDFDLTPPSSAAEAANAIYLANIGEEYGFLPVESEMIRGDDLAQIEACLIFATESMSAVPLNEEFSHDLSLALGCICFRDHTLRSAAIILDYEDAEAQGRLLHAVKEIMKNAFPN